MKIVALLLLAFGAFLFLPGCASEGEGYYTPSQYAAQHSAYDPTPRAYGSRY